MNRFAIAYLASAGAMLVLDFIWLSLAAQPLYKANLPGVMIDGFRPVPAVLFYLLYVGGIVYFAVLPGLEQASVLRAGINGALLGLLAYATYDLTNQATMKVWSTTVTVVDITWGMFITASAAAVGAWAALR